MPGHWEGDLVRGKAGTTALASRAERASRYPGIAALPKGRKDAVTTRGSLTGAVFGMPAHQLTSLTWDQGSELAAHAALTLATSVPACFARPHSPWERGTSKNTNRLIREHVPKGTTITDDQDYLSAVAAELNDRPRRILRYRTPAEVFTELLTSSIASTS